MNTPNPQGECVNSTDTNTCFPQGFKTSSIFYLENQPVEPKSWDGAALPISLLGTNEFVEIDSSNISASLYRMANFIRNRALEGKSKKQLGITSRLSMRRDGILWKLTITVNCSNNVSRQNLHRKILKVVQKRIKNLATLEKKQKFLGLPIPPPNSTEA